MPLTPLVAQLPHMLMVGWPLAPWSITTYLNPDGTEDREASYDTLVWFDEVRPKPTLAEIVAFEQPAYDYINSEMLMSERENHFLGVTGAHLRFHKAITGMLTQVIDALVARDPTFAAALDRTDYDWLLDRLDAAYALELEQPQP